MKTEIRLAKRQDIPALCEVWKSCFSDNEEYIRYFYKENSKNIDILVLTVDDKPVCMAHIFDATMVNGNEKTPAKYLYAGGTHAQYRGKGYFSILVKHIIKWAKENEFALFFIPASQTLVEFYRTFGFEPDARLKKIHLSPNNTELLTYKEISYFEYNRMRNKAFFDIPFVKWSDKYLSWCGKENEYYGGKMLCVQQDGSDFFLMGYPEDNTLIINVTNLSFEQLKKISGALCKAFGTQCIDVFMPETAGGEGEIIISSVIFNAPKHNTYVNLLLI